MNNRIKSIHVRRFKGINDAPFDTSPINVFIGANNSGKSTLAQVIHFSVGLLQSIELAGRWGNKSSVVVSLSPTQLLYSPCVDLYALGAGGQLYESADSGIEVSMTLDNGEKIELTIRKGRNTNILVSVGNSTAAKTIASIAKPFTIFSPGLAGIARNEEYISEVFFSVPLHAETQILCLGIFYVVCMMVRIRQHGRSLWMISGSYSQISISR